MVDTIVNDPTADQGPFRLNPPGVKGGLPEVPLETGMTGTKEAIPQLEEVQRRREQALRGREEDLSQQSTALSQAYSNRPQIPNLAKLGPAPDARDYQKGALEFASAMAVLGAIGSKFARIPGTAALSAFGGALKGWHEGNLEAYENAAKQWEENTKAVIQNNNFLIEQYDMELQNTALNIEQISANIKLKAAQFHDKIAYDNSDNITLIAQYRDKLEQWNNKLESSTESLLAQRRQEEATSALIGERVANGQIDLDGINPKTGQPFTTAEKLNYRRMADRYLAGFYGTPAKGGGIGKSAIAQDRQQFINEYTEEHGIPPTSAQITAWEGERAGVISGASASARTAATRETNLNILLRATDAAIPAALEASDRVPRGSYVPINRIIQQGKIATSNTALAQFGMANLQLAEHWARAMNPTGVMRETDRELALSFLSTATNKETYKALVEQLRTQIQRERTAINAGTQSALSAPGGGSPAAAPTSSPAAMSREDEMALGWARQNPNDPRAALILQKLGIQ